MTSCIQNMHIPYIYTSTIPSQFNTLPYEQPSILYSFNWAIAYVTMKRAKDILHPYKLLTNHSPGMVPLQVCLATAAVTCIHIWTCDEWEDSTPVTNNYIVGVYVVEASFCHSIFYLQCKLQVAIESMDPLSITIVRRRFSRSRCYSQAWALFQEI